jgi:hypothetical protein
MSVMKVGRPSQIGLADYAQFIWTTFVNFTQTYMADHHDTISHDSTNYWLRKNKIKPHLLWKSVKSDVIFSERSYLIFDDTVIDKSHSHAIEMVKKHYSGNAHGIVEGIPLVSCVYYNPDVDRYWVIDFRIFDIECDGKSKIDHVIDMIANIMEFKKISFKGVLMDTWYATAEVMQHLHKRGKYFYCPIKSNRSILIDGKYQSARSLEWTEEKLKNGIDCRLKGLNSIPLRAFRVARSSTRNEVVVTNDLSQKDHDVIVAILSHRWNIEQFHREIKQLTGIEACQCRKRRAQRNHIAVCVLTWSHFKKCAQNRKRTIYQLKNDLMENYMKEQLRNPSIPFPRNVSKKLSFT